MKLIPVGAAVIVAVVSLAGCGSARSSGPTPTPGTASPTNSSTPSPSASPTSTAAAVSPCADGIRVIEGESHGAAGHRTLVLIFNNASAVTCSLQGYPGVDLVSSNGAAVAHATRTLTGMAGGAAGLSSITLDPGQSASALVEASNVPQDSVADCGAYQLKVTPPGQYVATSPGTATMPRCDLQVHPVVAGTGGGMR